MEAGKGLYARRCSRIIPEQLLGVGADRGSDPGVDVTRLGLHRDTHLTRVEIAAEALRCFDESATAPSIRHLATVLRVTPSAIYHHYLSRADIIQAAVDLVWDEAIARFLEAVPDPFAADPVEVLVTAGIVTRETFTAHYQMAPFITVTRQSSAPLSAILALMSDVFERMGMDQDEAAAAFHIYASFTIGSVLFAATRRITDEQLLVDGAAGHPREQHSVKPTGRTDGQPTADSPTIEIQQAIGEIIDLSTVDPDRDAALFEEGLRQLVSRSKPADPRAPGPA